MEELIKITEHDGEQAVSARELYSFLEVNEKFTDWAKRMFEYGFDEKSDFIRDFGKSTGGRPSTDYVLSLDCAKEISMLQRSDKGKEARRYFIQCEKAMLEIHKRVLSPKELAQMVIDAENEKELAEQKLLLANTTIQKQAPKVKYVDEVLNANNTHPTNIIAKELGMSAVELNRVLKNKGVQYKTGETWVLTVRYQDKGYTKTKTHTYYDTEGKQKTAIQTCWTEKGRAFIHHLLSA